MAGLLFGSPPVQAAGNATDHYYNANALCQRGLYPLAAKEYEAFLAANPRHEKAPRARWGLAICYYSMAKMDKAAALFAGLVGNPQIEDQAQLHNLWAAALLALGKTDPAIKAFAWTVGHAKQPDRKADALFGLTQAHLRQAHWQPAIDASDSLITSAPHSPHADAARYLGALARMRLGRYAEAKKSLEALVAHSKDGEQVHEAVYQIAECLVQLDKLAEAAAQYEQAATVKPGQYSEAASFNVGLLRFRMAQYKEAMQSFRAFLKKYPQTSLDAQANLFIGRCFLEQKRYREAAGIFDGLRNHDKHPKPERPRRPKSPAPLAIGDSPIAARATLWLARTYARQNQSAQVIALLKPALGVFKNDPTAPELYYELARAQMACEKFAEAARSFAAAGRGRPPLPQESLRLQAFCQFRAGDYNQAMRLCDAFVSQYPDSASKAEVLLIKGETLSAMGRQADAAAILVKARQTGLDQVKTNQAQWRIAQTYYQQKKWDLCLTALKPLFAQDKAEDIETVIEHLKKTRRRPKRPPAHREADDLLAQAWFLAGDCHLRLEQWDQAAAALGTFVWRYADQPNFNIARYNLALALRKLDQPKNAIVVLLPFREARPKKPEDQKLRIEALVDLGRLQYESGDYRAAQDTLRRAPNNPDAIYYLGWSTMKVGDFNAAINYFGQLARQRNHPLATDAALQRAFVQYRTGRYADGEKTLADLIQHMPRGARNEQRSEALFYLGLCRARQKQYDKAIDSFRQVPQQRSGRNKRLAESLYWRAWCEKQRGDMKAAEGLLANFVARYPTEKLFPAATLELADLRFQKLQEAERQTRHAPSRKGRRPQSPSKPDYAAIADQLRPLLASNAKVPVTGELRARVLYLLGWALFKDEQWGPSAAAFEQLISAEEAAARADRTYRMSRLVPSACFQAGEARRHLKEFGPAKELFAKAARLRGEVPTDDQDDMLLRLAQLQAINNQWKESLQSARTLLKSFPKSTLRNEALFSIGWAYENMKKYREAMATYRQVVAADQRNNLSARAQFQIAECLFAQGQYDDAIAQFNLVVTKFNIPRWNGLALLGMGRSFQAQGQSVQARSYFDDVLLKYPDTTAAELARKLLEKKP